MHDIVLNLFEKLPGGFAVGDTVYRVVVRGTQHMGSSPQLAIEMAEVGKIKTDFLKSVFLHAGPPSDPALTAPACMVQPCRFLLDGGRIKREH